MTNSLNSRSLASVGCNKDNYLNYIYRAGIFACNLQKTDLRYRNFKGADLRQSIGQGTDFRLTNLYDARFEGADLRNADFRGADLRQADFSQAKMNGAKVSPEQAKLLTAQGLSGFIVKK